MRVADHLAQRESSWRELDILLDRLDRERRNVGAADLIRFSELYRAACTDLMLAEAYHLPRGTVSYLHGLVGRAHNALYRARGFRIRDWAERLFILVPRRLRSDPAVRISAVVFFGSFLICALMAAGRPGFAARVVDQEILDKIEESYAQFNDRSGRNDTVMAGFYIQHNAGIGLQCFAWGLIFGLGSLYELLSNGIMLGAIFGFMATSAAASNFFEFVTAHAPFELSAIVLSGAAGLRLGFGLIDTQGQTRLASLRREALNALPTVGAAVLLFVLAAFVEGYVSASRLPYAAKAAVALVCVALLAAYLMLGGRERPEDQASPALP
jgi:uncharacterized membrane protein SpoIIM required for sporulation